MMFININIKKGSMKALFLGIFALVWFWYQATNAAYVDGLYVWDNAQRYTTSTEWKAWSSLFKALKGTMSDKAFADKYGKPIDMLLNEYLPTAPSDKKKLFQVLSALNKDLLNQVSWKTNQNQESKKENINEKVSVANNTKEWKYNSDYLTDNQSKGDEYYWNTNESNFEEDDNSFEWFGGNFKTKNPPKKKETKITYTKDDLWKDMYSIKWNMGYIESIWKPWKTKDDYAYHIKAAELVRWIINDNDSENEKIEKIHSFLRDKYYSSVWEDPVAELEEYTSRATNLWADKTRWFALPFNWWQGVCQWYNDMYAEMLQIAWVKATVQKQTWYAPTGVAHMHLLVGGRVTDALWRWTAWNSKIFDLTGEIRNNFNYNK